MSNIRRSLLLALVLAFVCMFSGCEILEQLWEAVMNNFQDAYPRQSNVYLLVIPPYPLVEDENLEREALDRADKEAGRLQRALRDACFRFNEHSQTKLIPIDMDKERISNFYRKELINAKRNCMLNNQQFNVISFAKTQLLKYRSDYTNDKISCISFGLYKYDRNATAEKFVIYYYDISKDSIGQQSQVVTKVDGREREKNVEDLMYNLLKKVYD